MKPTLRAARALLALASLIAFLLAPALHAANLVVTSSGDSGAGSLRQAVLDATTSGDTITFHSSLNGATITLTSGAEIVLGKSLTIDATGLGNGITVSGGTGTNRIFSVSSGQTVAMHGLTLRDGDSGGFGGAINNSGTLSLTDCTLTANTAGTVGGAIRNAGSLTATRCTFFGNTAANNGGAVANDTGGTVSFTNCTFSGNTQTAANTQGGGAVNSAAGAISATFTHCTFTGNTSAGSDGGGALRVKGAGVTLAYCIVYGNAANGSGTGPDLYNSAALTFTGANIVVAAIGGGGSTSGPAPVITAPTLGALASNGGRTPTCALLTGSPTGIDAATGSTATADQRGFPIVGTADIGAYEAQIGTITQATTNEDTTTGAIPFNVGTVGTLSASSSNTTLLPNGNITLGGSGGSRTITLQPAANQSGSAAITVSDAASGDVQTFTLTVNAVNDAPSFTKGADQSVAHNASAQTVTNWATTISAGPADESGQTLTFTVTNDNNALFAAQPAIASNGTLTFTPMLNANGSATVSVTLSDDGGTGNGGANTSAVQTFTITVIGPFIVSNASDSGAGSLRQAVLDAAAQSGADTIIFAPSFTGPIVLSSEIVIGSSVTIDASAVAGGVTIDGGPGTNRIFYVNNGQTVMLNSLTLTGGGGTGAASSGSGGAIYNNHGTLTLTQCTLTGNTASLGGAITSDTSDITSAITSSTTLTQCTLSGNTATGKGGAVYNYLGRTQLTQCTVSNNTAPASQGSGIASFGLSDTETRVQNCIIAANTNSSVDYTDKGINSFTSLGGNLIGSGNATGHFNQSGDVINDAALLAPLGNYGGPTRTMPPLRGSPAIDPVGGATTSAFPTDQRGAPRLQDGDGNGSAIMDIGAVEFVPTVVSSTADAGANTLRDALAQSFASTITFAPSLDGQTITLASPLVPPTGRKLTVDALAPAGLTISGNNTTRLFNVNAGAVLALQRVTLMGGRSVDGGAISNAGTVTLSQCTLMDNTATNDGGAISNAGTVTLSQCTLMDNTATNDGGAISNSGILTLTQCTLVGNAATNDGGAIASSATLTLTQCTLASNSASLSGGAVHNAGALTLTNTIVAGNTATNLGPDICKLSSATVSTTGVNLIGVVTDSGLTPGTSVLTGPANLAPFGNYGGPTLTMPPLPGSPAIDPVGGATTSAFPTDQRGSSRMLDGDGDANAIVDIGAVEFMPLVVTNTNNSGSGSLRSALSQPYASSITFAAVVSGGTITLDSAFSRTTNVVVDARALPAGLTINGGSGTNNILTVNAGLNVTLHGLTLTGAHSGAMTNHGTLTLNRCILTSNTPGPGDGGALSNDGIATLTQCTLSDNSAPNGNGGAIMNDHGTMTLTQCTLSGNSAPGHDGGAIYNDTGSMTLTQCTLAGNSAGSSGAIFNNSALTLTHCTLAANASDTFGGAINWVSGSLTLTNTIVAGNTAVSGGPDIYKTASAAVALNGRSLIGSIAGSGIDSKDPAIITGAANLSSLGNHGGPTLTMLPLSGSPVIDAIPPANAVPGLTTDQRGVPLGFDGNSDGIAGNDIGAVEMNILMVTTRADENDSAGTLGSGLSLREAVRDVAAGGIIGFDPAIFDGSTATANSLVLTLGPLNPQRDCTLLAQPMQGAVNVTHRATIYQQPQSLSLPVGTWATFNIGVMNVSDGMSTQWRFKGGNVTGLPNPTFSYSRKTFEADDGVVDVVLGELPTPGTITLSNVSLAPFAATSLPATLVTGKTTVSILTQPIGALLPVGGSTTLRVVAIGPAAPQPGLTYQWKRGTTNVSGATGSSYTISNAQLRHAGAYTCVVTSGFDSVTSGVAEVGVVETRPQPAINATVGQRGLTFNVQAAGDHLSFAWMRNGSPRGVITRSLTINTVSAVDEALYTCIVTGPTGESLSNGCNTRLNVATSIPVLGTISLPPGQVTVNYHYQIPEAVPTSNRKATRFTVLGLPTGLSCDPTTGIISGRPTQGSTASFHLTISAQNARGGVTAHATLDVNLMPAPAVGTFTGIGDRDSNLNDNLGARFTLTSTGNGTCSGNITLGARAAQPFVNQLLLSSGSGDAVISSNNIPGITMADKTPLTAIVQINVTTGFAQLTLTHPYGNQLVIVAQRNPWGTTPATPFATRYALALDGNNFTTPAADNTKPQGFGYSTFTINPQGTLTLAGKLPDGTAMTGSSFVGAGGTVLVFQLLYANKGSVLGGYNIAPASPVTSNTITGSLDWMKLAQATTSTDTVYKAGFGPLMLAAQGGAYVAPLAGQRVMGAAVATAPNTNSTLHFDIGGLASSFTQPVRIACPTPTSLTNTATMGTPVNNSTALPTLTASTGAFSGSFSIPGATAALKRTAPFFGQLVKIGSTTQGYGYFLLPSVPVAPQTVATSPKLSGRVQFTVP